MNTQKLTEAEKFSRKLIYYSHDGKFCKKYVKSFEKKIKVLYQPYETTFIFKDSSLCVINSITLEPIETYKNKQDYYASNKL